MTHSNDFSVSSFSWENLAEMSQAFFADEGQEEEQEKEQKNILLAAKAFFVPFSSRLDAFVQKQGYTGDLEDIPSKVRFLVQAFEKAGIPVLKNHRRTIRDWFATSMAAPITREYLYQTALAFHLNAAQARAFFETTCLQRFEGFHTRQDLVYQFALLHQVPFQKIKPLLEEQTSTPYRQVDVEESLMSTRSVQEALSQIQDLEELRVYLNNNPDLFSYESVRARQTTLKMWNSLVARQNQESSAMKHASDTNRLLEMLGLYYIDPHDPNRKSIYTIPPNRSIRSLLKKSSLLHTQVMECFPDRLGLQKLRNGQYLSVERLRKQLILFGFVYKAWELEQPASQKKPTENLPMFIDALLLSVSYPRLQPEDPYDWLFLFCMQNQQPLSAFQELMQLVYVDGKESAST